MDEHRPAQVGAHNNATFDMAWAPEACVVYSEAYLEPWNATLDVNRTDGCYGFVGCDARGNSTVVWANTEVSWVITEVVLIITEVIRVNTAVLWVSTNVIWSTRLWVNTEVTAQEPTVTATALGFRKFVGPTRW